MKDDTKIIANPSMLHIGFSFAGILFTCGFTYFIYDSKYDLNDDAVRILRLSILVFFIFFSVLCFYMLLKSKKITLTNELLTIKYPLLFYTKNIDFDNIKRVREENYNIKHSRNFSTTEIYSGKKIIIEFYESKKTEITSLEVSNYQNLSKNLKNITTSYFKIKVDHNNDNLNRTNIRAYLWMFLIIVLAFGLIISIIQKKLKTDFYCISKIV